MVIAAVPNPRAPAYVAPCSLLCSCSLLGPWLGLSKLLRAVGEEHINSPCVAAVPTAEGSMLPVLRSTGPCPAGRVRALGRPLGLASPGAVAPPTEEDARGNMDAVRERQNSIPGCEFVGVTL